MKKKKHLNWLYALLLLVAGMGFASCSEDNKMDIPPVEEEVVNEAGDNFYMFVNGAWHHSLNATEDKNYGFQEDVDEMIVKRRDDLLKDMEETKRLEQSYEYLMAEGLEENQAYLDSIIDVIGECAMSAQSKHELGLYVGEWIKKGYLENMFRLYTTISEHEDKICYTICPDQVTLKLAGASQDGDDEEGEEARHFKSINYQKYTCMTRGGEDFISSIVDGMGLDPNCFMIADSLNTFYENFNAMSLDELKETIIGSAGSELFMYCGDDNTSEATNGYTDNTRDVLDAHLRHLLTYPLSYYYCEKYVDDEVKAKYGTYAETIRSVFAKRIEKNSWLSGETKEKALEKLNNMKFFIGEPDEWNLETFPKLNSKLFVENILEAKQSRINTALSLIGKPKRENCIPAVILALGGMGTYAYNAFHIPSTNAMAILNCFMTAPEYTEDMQPADLYALFYVIGHELTHGFDKMGSQYDANGNLNNWWTAEDKEKFDALNDALAQQISTFEIAPGIMANGYRTVTEDVADLGGLNIAFDALNEYLAEQGVTGEELKEAQKAYFERHAYRYRTVYGKLYFQKLLKDTHSVALVRVNGIVQHMDAWYDLYNVSEGDSLYLPADKRITIW